MSDREELAEWFHDTTMDCAHRGDILECVLRARNLLESDWLAKHDADILAPIRALVEAYDVAPADADHRFLGDDLADAIRAALDTPAQADGGEVRE